MNVNGKVCNMFSVREAERLKYGKNKSNTLVNWVRE
jgi:hypothetical protein